MNRFGLFCSLILIGALCTTSQAFQPANNIRYAKKEKTKVYCGPSTKYYATAQLRQGTAVEIFHRNKDGWCAIRPPEGSFCWLAAENAYLVSGGEVAEIIGNKVPAWIGTDLESPNQFRWQIELQPTQQVKVIGEAKQAIDSDTQRLWYKIAPPQGEFRWVHEDSLGLQPPIADPTYPPLQSSPKTAVASSKESSKKKDNGQQPVATAGYTEQPLNLSPVAQDSKDPATTPVTKAQFAEELLPPPTNSSKSSTAAAPQGVVLQEGEYIVGDEVVVSDEVVGQSDGNGDVIYEDGMHEGEFIVEDGSPEYSSVHLSHADDPQFDQWNALNAPHGRILVRPLNGLLGLIGFGLEEAEIVEPATCSNCELGTCRLHGHVVDSTRLEHLPRPNRRHRGRSLGSLLNLGKSEPSSWQDERPDDLQTESFDSTRSLLAQEPIGNSPWHSTSASRPSSPPSFLASKNWGSTESSSSASIDSSPLQLSTPNLREAFFELTRIVSQPTEQWDLREVGQYAQERIESGQSAMERGEARLLAERIQQFERLRQKYLMAGNPGSMLASNSNGVTTAGLEGSYSSGASASLAAAWETRSWSGNSVSNAVGTGVGSSEAESAISMEAAGAADASGWLSPVHTSRPGQPEYALTDSEGKVLAYVTPSPGMNLRRYSKQPVAIYGTRGYLPELAAKQIIAERIIRVR